MVNLKKIREERKKKGITQKQMANLLGYKSDIAYLYIEKGIRKLKADCFIKIAKILEIDINELIQEDKND
ncbi:MAG: helix-turn-helix transcriptional regulator [Elusimicrobiota bacterium]|nr:helix-turn-helix domain-containing protein [Endomicrobiia bacterium]MDW8165991.1 helix-turn-helix transcriptional regulator [Elusimicrobiota bacterium]